MSNDLKRPANEEIDIAALGDSEVIVQFRLGKKLLAEQSEVFKRQFCGLMRNNGSSEDRESINLDDYSTEAKAAFVCYAKTGSTSFLKILDFGQLSDLLLLADKYKMKVLESVLLEEVNTFTITKNNLMSTVRTAFKIQSLSPLEKPCKVVLDKCTETIICKELDYIKLWSEDGNDGQILKFLMKLVEDYRETAKESICQNCRSDPCLNGKEVKEFRVGLKVSRIKTNRTEISTITSDCQNIKGFVQPDYDEDDERFYYEDFEDSRNKSRCTEVTVNGKKSYMECKSTRGIREQFLYDCFEGSLPSFHLPPDKPPRISTVFAPMSMSAPRVVKVARRRLT